MARRPLARFSEPEEDTRPTGGLQFADPSMQGYPSQINRYNHPESNCHGEGARRSNFGIPAPWATTFGGHQQFHDMNRKRGVSDSDDD